MPRPLFSHPMVFREVTPTGGNGGGGGPPSGPAGGDLTGTYPNPQIAAGAVGTAELTDGAVTRAKTAPDCWLSPIPMTGDVGDVLTVTAGPTLAWQPAAVTGDGVWLADPTNANAIIPVASRQWVRFANDTGGIFFGPAASPGVSGNDTAALDFWTGVTGYVWHAGPPSFAPIATLSNAGKLTVSLDPTAPLDVATKQYVDARGAATHIGPDPPSSPTAGQLWWRNDPDGTLYIFYDDGSSMQFVPAVGPAAVPLLAYRHVQATAETVWTIAHNLSFRPNVTAVDSTGREIWPGMVDYPSATSVMLTFSAAVGGEAYLS